MYDYEDRGGHYYIENRQVSHAEWADHLRQRKRVGREERERYVGHLSEMYAQEYLTQDEFRERSGKAAAAVTEFDLTSLVMDLPSVESQEKKKAEEKKAVAIQVPSQQPKPAKPVRKPVRRLTVSALGLFASLVVLCVPTPVAAHMYGGMGHTPLWFAIPLGLGIAGSSVFAMLTLLAATG